MSKSLMLIQIFNFTDWIIAFFIAGTAARIQGKDGRRTPLAVALGLFFALFGVIRICEFVNLVFYQEDVQTCLNAISWEFNRNAVVISAFKTVGFLFCWFGVTMERRERQGLLSGNVIRNYLTSWFDRLR